MALSALVYDTEIIRCIPNSRNPAWQPEPDLEYCEGWHDYKGMGISCITAYDYLTDSYRVFLEDNIADFQALTLEREHIIGFNSSSFDDTLCAAHGLIVRTTYDLLCEVRIASGQPPYYSRGLTRAGYSLNNLTKANLGVSKTASGELAPVLWQRGEYGAVISYCLNDVQLTRKLLEMGLAGELKDPVTGSMLKIRRLSNG